MPVAVDKLGIDGIGVFCSPEWVPSRLRLRIAIPTNFVDVNHRTRRALCASLYRAAGSIERVLAMYAAP